MSGALGLAQVPISAAKRLLKGVSPIVVSKERRPSGDAPYVYELRGAVSADARGKRGKVNRAVAERGRRYDAAVEDIRQRAAAARLERGERIVAERRAADDAFIRAQAGIAKGLRKIDPDDRRRRDEAFAKAQRDIRERERRRESGASTCKERPEDSRHSKGGGSRGFIPWCDADHGRH